MNPTLVKIIGIISLVTFILGLICAGLGIGFGIWMGNVSDDAYLEHQDTPGAERLFGVLGLFGGGALGVAALVAGICVAVYDAIAHIPALIAYLVGKKNGNVTVYWLMIGIWLSLLFGTSFFILVF